MITTFTRSIATLGLAAIIVGCSAPTVTPTPTVTATITPTVALTPTVAPVASVNTGAIDAFVTEMLETYEVPGAAIALVLPNGRTYTRGYGVRDTTTRAPVTADTQFGIASVTKSFTALGIMLLVDEGKVDLDALVTTYLPNFRLSDPAATDRVTVRHLLMHTTGMERNNEATGNSTITRDGIIAFAAQTPLVAAPGEQHIYSNVNTIAAARIIELVSGQSWEAFTRERILAPLGMSSATLDAASLQQQPDYALPHDLDLVDGMVSSAPVEPYAEAPAGGINASANEMLRYLQFQLGDGSVNGTRLLSPEAHAEPHRTQIAVDETSQGSGAARRAAEKGVPAPKTLLNDFGYGLYWYTENFQSHRIVEHDGQAPGYSASVSFAPDAGVGVVIMTNAHYAFGFVESVRMHILEELLAIEPRHDTHAIIEAQLALEGRDLASVMGPVAAVRAFTPDAAQLAALAASYTSLIDGAPVTVTVVEGQALRMEAVVQGLSLDLELVPIAVDSFLSNTAPFRGLPVQFTTDDAGTTLLFQGQPLAQR